jgi:hypothetical protein
LLIEFADNEYPCRLGQINNITQILASHQSEHDWRGMVYVSILTAGMCLGQTFLIRASQSPEHPFSAARILIQLASKIIKKWVAKSSE